MTKEVEEVEEAEECEVFTVIDLIDNELARLHLLIETSDHEKWAMDQISKLNVHLIMIASPKWIVPKGTATK